MSRVCLIAADKELPWLDHVWEFDLDTLGMLTETQYEPDLTGEYPDGLISQICITVEI